MGADRPETFRGHLPALAGSIVGTLLAAIVGSHVGGALGTRYALAVGAMISGTASWYGERAIRRGQAVAQAKLKAAKQRGRELTPEETGIIETINKSRFDWRHRGIHYRTIGLLALTALTVCLITIVSLNALGSRQVASFTPEPAPTITKLLPGRTQTVTTTPTYTQTVTPSATASVPSATPFGTQSATPIPSPDASPSVSATPTATGVTSVPAQQTTP